MAPSTDIVLRIPPENYKGDPQDVTALLLKTTQNTLELACASSTGYKGGFFQHTITANVHVSAALRLLIQNNRTTTDEKAVFRKAAIEVKKLRDPRLTNQNTSPGTGPMYLRHWDWFNHCLKCSVEISS
ncbi:hypothetical protein MMC26_005750 [Xylographa opegraphella]|nr:hypothetical protein [Xylographa opegraphella]